MHALSHGPLTRYVQLQGAHAQGMPETFSPPPRVSYPAMHHSTCVTHIPWCMLGSLTTCFLWSWWRGKRSRHSRRMRNPQFYVSGKRPMLWPQLSVAPVQHALSYTAASSSPWSVGTWVQLESCTSQCPRTGGPGSLHRLRPFPWNYGSHRRTPAIRKRLLLSLLWFLLLLLVVIVVSVSVMVDFISNRIQ